MILSSRFQDFFINILFHGFLILRSSHAAYSTIKVLWKVERKPFDGTSELSSCIFDRLTNRNRNLLSHRPNSASFLCRVRWRAPSSDDQALSHYIWMKKSSNKIIIPIIQNNPHSYSLYSITLAKSRHVRSPQANFYVRLWLIACTDFFLNLPQC